MRINQDGPFRLCTEAFDVEGLQKSGRMVGFEEQRKPAGVVGQEGG
jgi:hypothetical protein